MKAQARLLTFSAVLAFFAMGRAAAAATNGVSTNDLRWAHIVPEEHLCPSAGFLAMVAAFTDGSCNAPVADRSSADIPWGTPAVGGPTDFKTILDKYGQPSTTTNAAGTIAQTLLGKPRRPVSYHWYGAVAFITETNGGPVIGMAFRGDPLKQLAKEPDLQLAAQRCLDADQKRLVHASCQRMLRQLDDAKRRWALDTKRTEGDIPFAYHILDYLPGQSMPECPEGGIYRFNLVGTKPECSIHGDKY